jgi:hypothetical protein
MLIGILIVTVYKTKWSFYFTVVILW